MTDIVHVSPSAPVMWTPERVDLVKRTIANGATDDELALFLQVCERTGLDPFARQIHLVKRWSGKDGRDVASIQVGIDGFRLVAQRSGQYGGQEDIAFCNRAGHWTTVWDDGNGFPYAARAGVYRSGFTTPLRRIAYWSEVAQRNGKGELIGLWSKMPTVMLGKVAEAAALRAAFPAELSGLYVDGEMPDAPAPRPLPPERRDADGFVLLTDDNVARFLAYCAKAELEPDEVVLAGTNGRTSDPAAVRVAEMEAVSALVKSIVAARTEPEPATDTAVADQPGIAIEDDDLSTPEPPPARGKARVASHAQVGKVKGEYGRLGIEDRGTQLAWSMLLLGVTDLASHNDLTAAQASGLIELLVSAEDVEALDGLAPA